MSQLDKPQRITQIQCSQCNIGLQSQFFNWLSQAFKYTPNIINNIHHELQAIISFAQYKFTIARDKPQPGDFLQNIQFKPLQRKTKILWLLLSVVLPYINKKISVYLQDQKGQYCQKIKQIFRVFSKILTILQFFNYAIFILKGQYRSLIQRILSIQMIFKDPKNKRILNFSLMNRTLLWQIYQLFLKTTLPSLFSLFSNSLKNIYYLSSYLHPQPSKEKNGCIYCGNSQPVMPYQALPCKHQACYYCHQNQQSKCSQCSTQIQKWVSMIR